MNSIASSPQAHAYPAMHQRSGMLKGNNKPLELLDYHTGQAFGGMIRLFN